MDKDPFAEAQAGVVLAQTQAVTNPYLGYPHNPYPAQLTPEAQMRHECLYMALRAPDGAQVPPLDEALKRARAYWRFIQTGE